MGGGASVPLQYVIPEKDRDLWRRVISVEEHEKYQSAFLAHRSNKLTSRESYRATKAELLSNWCSDYSDTASNILERWGSCIVEKLLLVRTLQTNICDSAGSSSGAAFSEKSMTANKCDRLARSKKRDQLFTTELWFQLGQRLWISVEKKDVIFMKTMPKKSRHSQTCEILLTESHSSMFFRTFLGNARSYSGDDFFVYHVDKNNSEKFAHEVLKGNKLISLKVDEFLRQSTKSVLRAMFDVDVADRNSAAPLSSIPISTPSLISPEIAAVAVQNVLEILIDKTIEEVVAKDTPRTKLAVSDILATKDQMVLDVIKRNKYMNPSRVYHSALNAAMSGHGNVDMFLYANHESSFSSFCHPIANTKGTNVRIKSLKDENEEGQSIQSKGSPLELITRKIKAQKKAREDKNSILPEVEKEWNDARPKELKELIAKVRHAADNEKEAGEKENAKPNEDSQPQSQRVTKMRLSMREKKEKLALERSWKASATAIVPNNGSTMSESTLKENSVKLESVEVNDSHGGSKPTEQTSKVNVVEGVEERQACRDTPEQKGDEPAVKEENSVNLESSMGKYGDDGNRTNDDLVTCAEADTKNADVVKTQDQHEGQDKVNGTMGEESKAAELRDEEDCNKRNRRRIFNGDAKGKTIAMAGAATGGRAFKDVMREKKKRLAETMNSKRKLAESSAQVDATKKREVEEVEEMMNNNDASLDDWMTITATGDKMALKSPQSPSKRSDQGSPVPALDMSQLEDRDEVAMDTLKYGFTDDTELECANDDEDEDEELVIMADPGPADPEPEPGEQRSALKAPKHRESISSQYHARKGEERDGDYERELEERSYRYEGEVSIVYTNTPPPPEDCQGRQVLYRGVVKGVVTSIDDLHGDGDERGIFVNINFEGGDEETPFHYFEEDLQWAMGRDGNNYI